MTMWITEYALVNQPLAATQDFFKTSSEYFDRLDYVSRYSYFGTYRSDKSNVGPNAACLAADGRLTDIGAWYLGLEDQAKGVVPTGMDGDGSVTPGGSKAKVNTATSWRWPASWAVTMSVFAFIVMVCSS
jgi:hypothetical protein